MLTKRTGDEDSHGLVDIHRVLDSSVRMATNEIRHRARLVRDYGAVPQVEGNEPRLGQLFLNLIVNAAQAITDHGTITIRTFVEGEYAKIAVGDTGVGIAAENLSRIFDPGYTTKNVTHGTGLGLSICYKIIQNHHGTIEVESVPGKGSTFTVALPLEHLKESHNDGE